MISKVYYKPKNNPDAAPSDICQKSALFSKNIVISRYFWVKLCQFKRILDAALKF